ncbi:exopolyphosphatase [Escherichia coli]|nr:exopolyphosphatase [Escherichia coli]
MAAAQKLETLTWQFRIQGWNVAMGASGTIKAAHEVLMEMGEKDGIITPERLEKLVKEVLRHRNFASLSFTGSFRRAENSLRSGTGDFMRCV